MNLNLKKMFSFKNLLLNLVALFIISLSGFSQSYNYEKATEAYKAEDYDLALDFYTREISDNPKNNDAYFYRASIYHYKDNNSLALSDINIALKNYSKKDKASLAACHSLKAKIYVSIEEVENAIEEYNLAIKLSPDYQPYYISRAQLFFEKKQYDKAEADYRTILKMDEGDVQALASLARNFMATDKDDEAEKLLNKIIKLSPEYKYGYFYRSILFYKQKKYNEAIVDAFYLCSLKESDKDNQNFFINYANKNIILSLSKVNAKISLYPEKDDWYFIRAQLYEKSKDYFAAIADYNKMLDISDASYRASILSYRADCYKNEGLHDQAISDYTELIADDSTYAYHYSSRGEVKKLKKDYAGAISDFSKAIKIKPDNDWLYFGRARIKDQFLNDVDGALKDYSEAISISSNYSYTYLARGRFYKEKIKDEKKAKEDFLMILQLDTAVDYSGNCRAYALFYLNRNKEALEWQNKILEEYPNEFNHYDASCLHSLMKMPKEAIDNLRLAFENGFRNFIRISNDEDFNNVKNNPDFIALIKEWKTKYELTKSKNPIENKIEEIQKYQTTTIPMKARGSGTYEVSCKVNDLKLNFIFDTGASDISISQTEALFMLKNDYLTEADIKGKEKYMDANGDISVGTKIMLKKVEIGGLVLKNVSASVVNNKNAPLLFGQSALSKYGKIIIDNKKNEITISIPEGK